MNRSLTHEEIINLTKELQAFKINKLGIPCSVPALKKSLLDLGEREFKEYFYGNLILFVKSFRNYVRNIKFLHEEINNDNWKMDEIIWDVEKKIIIFGGHELTVIPIQYYIQDKEAYLFLEIPNVGYLFGDTSNLKEIKGVQESLN